MRLQLSFVEVAYYDYHFNGIPQIPAANLKLSLHFLLLKGT